MYEVDTRDKVIELHDLPRSSAGAPCPIVLASDHRLAVAYYLRNPPANWDGMTVRVVGPDTPDSMSVLRPPR